MTDNSEKRCAYKSCSHCLKCIDFKKDKYVDVHTCREQPKMNDHVYFHFHCWEEYFNNAVTKKAKAILWEMQQRTVEMVERSPFSEQLQAVGGVDNLMKMVKTNLNEVNKNLIEETDKKKNGSRSKNKKQD
jgi:hypothetical protein